MILPEYKTIEDKNPFFSENLIIDTPEDLEIFLEFLRQSPKKYFYRGVSEAKYKMYNSAQRYYIQHNILETGLNYSDFILKLIDYAKTWNLFTINNYFAQVNGANNDFAYLSVLQHYANLSPMIDLTLEPIYSLFFACDSIDFKPSDQKIDNYFSVYLLPKITFFHDSVDYLYEGSDNLNFSYKNIAGKDLIITIGSRNRDKKLFINNTLNILNQQGLFVLSTYEEKPLENAILDEESPCEETKEISKELNCFRCYNINKNLSQLILNRLRNAKVTKEFIYPDLWKLRCDLIKDLNFVK